MIDTLRKTQVSLDTQKYIETETMMKIPHLIKSSSIAFQKKILKPFFIFMIALTDEPPGSHKPALTV